MYQQQYGYGGNQGYSQQTGYPSQNNWSSQPQQQQPSQQQQQTQFQLQQQQQYGLQSQPTGYGFGTQTQQPPQLQSFNSQQQQPQLQSYNSQQNGWNQQPPQQQPLTSFQSQPTGGQGLTAQRTGYQPQAAAPALTSQATGWNQQQAPPMTSFQAQATGGLMQQRTGYQQPSIAPLATQSTGWNQQQAPPMTSFQAQATGGLMQQRTGYQQQQQQQQQPLMSQTTGWNQLQQPPTSFGSMPLQSQVTGYGSLQPQQTGTIQPLTAQPTGFISSLTSLGSQSNDLVLPNIRLSFITARDQERFETIFRNNVPKGENAMDGNTARTILMKSQLSATQLSQIWELADTNKSGSLMFPEFCVALHLANMSKRGQSVPYELPIKIKNEVTGFVDAINFNIGAKNDNVPYANNPILNPQRTGFTPLNPQQTAGLIPIQQQPQQQPGMLTSQPTGIFSQRTGGGLISQATGSAPPMTSFAAQQTGGLMLQPTNFYPQQTGGFQSQQTGGLYPQQTGGFQSQPTGGLYPQQTGFQTQPTGGLYPQQTGLQPMPTGRPGQWGFVSMPTGGLPGLDAMQSHFMPNSQAQAGVLQNQMGGSTASNVTWAITKQEKLIYDNIFKQWDKERKGFVNGDIAIGVFTKSGLSFGDLEKIWTLCDQGNKGKLNRDEFAVAMHLIYRRLNGFEIPIVLPPELIPPSSKVLESTVDNLKDELKKQAANGGVGSPLNVKQGVTRSGTNYKNDDNSINYVSNSRHRRKSEAESSHSNTSSNAFSTKLTVDDLKKQIHEKKILLSAVDAQDGDINSDYEKQKSLNEIEMIKTKIKSLQSQLNSSNTVNVDSIEQKEQLRARLNKSSDKAPQLVDAISQIDDKIKAAKIEIFRLKLQKENPSGIDFRGTGPNGEITETDKRIAKQKALLQAKMAKLTGKPAPNFDAFESNESKLNQEIVQVTKESDDQKLIVKDIESAIKTLLSDVADSLNLTNSMSVGYNKWEKKEGIQNKEIADFIDYLNSTKPAHKTSITAPSSLSNPYLNNNSGVSTTEPPVVTKSVESIAPETSTSSTSTTLPSGLTAAEERAKRIKEKAEKRMNERLAKLGITRKKTEQEPETKPVVEAKSVESFPIPAPVAVPIATPVATQPVQNSHVAPAPPTSRSSQAPPPPTASKPKSFDSDSDSSDEEDDEEYKALLAKKLEMEKREKEKKERRKREKEEKLAKLKAEMAALEKENQESDDSWDEEPKKKPVAAAASVVPVSKAIDVSSPSIQSAPSTTHSNNPFASMTGDSIAVSAVAGETKKETHASESSTPGYNPFAKLQPNTTGSAPVDVNKLKAQRESQMGKGNDDDWSESENDASEDEMPSANKQAELASMLFGGSAQPSRTTTYVPPTTEESKEIETDVEPVTKEPESTVVAPVAPVAPAVFPPPISDVSTTASVPEIKEDESVFPIVETPPPLPHSMPPIPMTSAPPAIPQIEPPELLQVSNESKESNEFYDAKSEESSFIDPTPPSSPEVADEEVPELPTETIPPLPTGSAPPLPTSMPPIPTNEVQSSLELPSSIPPPPPMLPSSIPPPPPPPPPPAPAPPAAVPAPNASATGAPNINALLGEISMGTMLKKVETHVSSGASVGKVLD